MKLAMNSFPSGRYIEEGSIWQRLLNGIVVSIPMFCIGGAYRSRGYTERTSMRCSYRKSSLVMGKLLVSFLVTGVVFLTACGGGGGSSGSSPTEPEPFTRAELEVVSFGDNFTIRLENYDSLPGNVTEIVITPIVGNVEGNAQSISRQALMMQKGEFVLVGLMSGQRYRFSLAVVYTDTSRSSFPIYFVESEHREDHASGGILLGPNSDGRMNGGDGDGSADRNLTVIADNDTDPTVIADNTTDGGGNSAGMDLTITPDDDTDGDNVTDSVDIDDDGDGLIEIRTAAELDAVRYQLDGTGLRLNATASFNDTGCGGSKGIMSCNGYELVNNISLTGYIATTYPNHGWLPIGYDARSNTNAYCRYASSDFSAIFEGNHFVISGLSIDRPEQKCIGFFAFLGNEGEVHRLGLEVDEIRGDWVVGGLVASSERGLINSSYAMVASLTGHDDFVGGLVGQGFGIRLDSSYTIIASLTGDDFVGGLVGNGNQDVAIHSSYAVIDSLNGEKSTGGLIGRGDGRIKNSYAVVRSLTGEAHVGGLVGKSGENEDDEDWMAIDSSYAIIGSLNGDRNVGGLVGVKSRGRITSSYAIFNTSLGDRYVGGLIGGTFRSDIISSYAIFNNITSKSSADDNGAGGLIGQAAGGRLISSYVIANSLEGDGHVGGFVGNSTAAFRAGSSYGVFGSLTRTANLNIDTLIGSYRSSPTISNSYWNSETTNLKTGTLGEPKLGSELTGPTDYGGIYDAWDDGVDLDGGGVDDITIYCDSDLSGTIETAERTDDNRIWDFGSTDEYPAIGCTPDNPPAAQRAWWSLNDRGEPTLDNERLDEVLDSHFP